MILFCVLFHYVIMPRYLMAFWFFGYWGLDPRSALIAAILCTVAAGNKRLGASDACLYERSPGGPKTLFFFSFLFLAPLAGSLLPANVGTVNFCRILGFELLSAMRTSLGVHCRLERNLVFQIK